MPSPSRGSSSESDSSDAGEPLARLQPPASGAAAAEPGSMKPERQPKSKRKRRHSSGSDSDDSPAPRARALKERRKSSKEERRRERREKRGKKAKKSREDDKKDHKHKKRKTSPVQLSKFMKDGGGASYSVVSGKKIKMKVEQSREDKILAQKRQKLLAFLNSSVE